MQRYFTNKKNNNEMILCDDDIRHIKVVMRMKKNDEIIVTYLNDSYLCYISDNYKIIIKEKLERIFENIPKVTLVVPILKENKLDYILQKSTELGVFEIILYYSNRGVIKQVGNDTKKIERWRKIVKEASEQCHRSSIPDIKISSLSDLEVKKINLICSTIEKTNFIKNSLKTLDVCDTISVVIGPEGGFDTKEESTLITNGYIPVTFGNRILRVETVPIFIMSIINYEFME